MILRHEKVCPAKKICSQLSLSFNLSLHYFSSCSHWSFCIPIVPHTPGEYTESIYSSKSTAKCMFVLLLGNLGFCRYIMIGAILFFRAKIVPFPAILLLILVKNVLFRKCSKFLLNGRRCRCWRVLSSDRTNVKL